MTKKETRKLVRCINSGVFFGKLKKLEGTKAVLKNARNIWSWEGANGLNSLAKYVVKDDFGGDKIKELQISEE